MYEFDNCTTFTKNREDSCNFYVAKVTTPRNVVVRSPTRAKPFPTYAALRSVHNTGYIETEISVAYGCVGVHRFVSAALTYTHSLTQTYHKTHTRQGGPAITSRNHHTRYWCWCCWYNRFVCTNCRWCASAHTYKPTHARTNTFICVWLLKTNESSIVYTSDTTEYAAQIKYNDKCTPRKISVRAVFCINTNSGR